MIDRSPIFYDLSRHLSQSPTLTVFNSHNLQLSQSQSSQSSTLTIYNSYNLQLSHLKMGNTTSVTCNFHSAAIAGDTCQSFATEWGSTLSNFESINPGINCTTNLVAGQSYCVVGTVVTVTPTSAAASTSTPIINPSKSGCATVTVTSTVTTTATA